MALKIAKYKTSLEGIQNTQGFSCKEFIVRRNINVLNNGVPRDFPGEATPKGNVIIEKSSLLQSSIEGKW